MSDFYINVLQRADKLLVREFKDGKRIKHKVKYQPTFYVPVQKETEFKTLTGHYVAPYKCESIYEAKSFLEKYDEQPNLVFGMERFPYTWIAENYDGVVDWDMNKLFILTLDIEVRCDNGFPDPELAEEEMLCITVKNHANGEILVWGLEDYSNDRKDVNYFHCRDEKHLLEKFLEFWDYIGPDVITGWNVKFFDIPYLCNRITKILDEEEIKRLSPWGVVHPRMAHMVNRQMLMFDILGVSILDYMDLYKKYTYTNQESYALNHIAYVELGETKHENPHETFRDWYTNDYQSFVDYNIQDVELVDRLEDKMKLIELHLTMAYEAKINPNDVFSQVRMWDVIMYNFLREKNFIVPVKKPSRKDAKYEGAYVKDPQTGLHNWVMSFDLNSLYPHLIMQYNISPETMAKEGNGQVNVEKMLKKEVDIPDDGYTVTPNGARFRTNQQGFLPALMEKFYSDRVKFKKWTLEAKQRYEDTKDPKYKNEVSKYNNIQMARKIALNSAYGAVGNQYFRYYDEKMATAITTSGQLSIRWIENKVNEYLNKILSTTDVDYIIASDTDSIYVTFDELVSKVNPKNPVDFLDKVAKEKLEPYITKCFEELAEYVNAYQQKMDMAREVIADKGIWTAKKRYILNVHDSEGVRYAEPQLKIMGIEAVKSSTPEPCRDMIKTALKVIINEDEITLNTFIQDFRKEFMVMPAERIAYPRSCNGLKKWGDSSSIFKKSCPMHIKGALIYNFLLKKNKLSHKYPFIQEGDKIKFIELRTPNIMQANVISFMTKLPKEFDLQETINYDIMFDKSFVEPLTFILEQINWQVDRSYGTQRTLEALFG
ncbi:MAG: DNA polymerase [Chloroflexi bacterium]|nr:DNA polymerase [Chloroflexota bacterium]